MWAQSCTFSEIPRCAKQLVCRQLWAVHVCRLGELGVKSTDAGRGGAAWCNCTCTDADVQSSSKGDGAKLSRSGLSLPVYAQGSLLDLG